MNLFNIMNQERRAGLAVLPCNAPIPDMDEEVYLGLLEGYQRVQDIPQSLLKFDNDDDDLPETGERVELTRDEEMEMMMASVNTPARRERSVNK